MVFVDHSDLTREVTNSAGQTFVLNVCRTENDSTHSSHGVRVGTVQGCVAWVGLGGEGGERMLMSGATKSRPVILHSTLCLSRCGGWGAGVAWQGLKDTQESLKIFAKRLQTSEYQDLFNILGMFCFAPL